VPKLQHHRFFVYVPIAHFKRSRLRPTGLESQRLVQALGGRVRAANPKKNLLNSRGRFRLVEDFGKQCSPQAFFAMFFAHIYSPDGPVVCRLGVLVAIEASETG